MQGLYYVYLLENKLRSFYCVGITCNIVTKMKEAHLSNRKSSIFYRNVTAVLVYYEVYGIFTDAVIREKEMKSWSKTQLKGFLKHKL